MAVGDSFAPEWRTFADPETGRSVRQYTAARANSYPLYYYVPSITDDGDVLVFHSERSGWVQLYRMDLATGEIRQLTNGRTRDAGWAVWCEYHLRGVFNHLSALNTIRREVYYFDEDALYRSALDTCEIAKMYAIPGRVPIGQSAFSPDGQRFAFVHADTEQFRRSLADREALLNMGQPFDHEAWRRALHCTITVLDTATGDQVSAIDVEHHVHHLLFVDDSTLLCCHTADGDGMWSIPVGGGPRRLLRPADEHGRICHFVVTAEGILYDANKASAAGHEVRIGRYEPRSDTWNEWRLPADIGYVHVGNDPNGRLLFVECESSTSHHISMVEPADGGATLHHLRTLSPIPAGQRHHAHPFLAPDRRHLFYTELIDGFSQICSIDVGDRP